MDWTRVLRAAVKGARVAFVVVDHAEKIGRRLESADQKRAQIPTPKPSARRAKPAGRAAEVLQPDAIVCPDRGVIPLPQNRKR